MPKSDPGKLWSLNYRLLMSVITSVAPDIAALGLETKELFVLAGSTSTPIRRSWRPHCACPNRR
jgi:hypothetical protein